MGNKPGRVFCVWQVLLYKIVPKNLGACKPTFYILFIHHIWGETVLWDAVFIIQTSDRMQYFTILQYKLHSLNIQDDGMHAWAFSETVKKISKITHTASRFSTILTSAKWMNNYRDTLQHSKEFIMFIMFIIIIIFLFDGFITMCNLRKRLIRAAFWVLLQAVFMNDWKQTAQQLKLQERQRTINKINIIRWTIYRDNNFHSRRQVLKCL